MPICTADKEGGPKQVFVSKGTGTNHTVTEWMTGYWSCTCPDWRMRRNLLVDHSADAPDNNHCKHVRDELARARMTTTWPGYTPATQAYETRTRRQRYREWDEAQKSKTLEQPRSSQLTGRAISLGDEEV